MENFHLPPPMLEAVTALWEANFATETQAILSGRFRMLCHVYSTVYLEIPGSRLSNSPTGDFDRQQFQAALRRFFCWTGAPWHPGSPRPSAQRAAEQLHCAFLAPQVKRTYLVPLDRLALEDATKRPSEDLKHLRFGRSEVMLLEERDFARQIPVDALKRFEPRHRFEPEKYAGLHCLILSDEEQAGAIWQRNMWGILYDNLSERLIPLCPGRLNDVDEGVGWW